MILLYYSVYTFYIYIDILLLCIYTFLAPMGATGVSCSACFSMYVRGEHFISLFSYYFPLGRGRHAQKQWSRRNKFYPCSRHQSHHQHFVPHQVHLKFHNQTGYNMHWGEFYRLLHFAKSKGAFQVLKVRVGFARSLRCVLFHRSKKIII